MLTFISLAISILAYMQYVRWYRYHLYTYDPKTRRHLFNGRHHWATRFLFDYYGVQFIAFVGSGSVVSTFVYEQTGNLLYLLGTPVCFGLFALWLKRVRPLLDEGKVDAVD